MSFDDAYNCFVNQRINARKKQGEFTLTFKEWLDIWGDDLERKGQLQMQRIDKELGYVPGNLRIGSRP